MAKYKTQTEVIDEARPFMDQARSRLYKEYKEGKLTQDEWLEKLRFIDDCDRRVANDKEKTFGALKKSQYASALFILEYTSDN